MGDFIRNPHDLTVKYKLDNLFADPHLRNLRNRIHGPGATEPNFFDDPVPGHRRHLHRISHRLKIWPDPIPPGEPPPTVAELKARWQWLLQKGLTDPVKAAQLGTTVAELIRTALQVFVVTDDPQCTGVAFDVTHDAGLPAGIDYQVDIHPDPNVPRPASYAASMLLRCRQDIPVGASEPDPGPDTGEVRPEQPPF